MFDTDIASYIMKRSHEAVLYRLRRTAPDDVCISVITKAELLYGVEVSPNPQRDQTALDGFLRHVEVLEFPEEAALHYGQIRAQLRHQGITIGGNDLFIAAHARFAGLTLVSNNLREFSRVEQLKVENWSDGPI